MNPDTYGNCNKSVERFYILNCGIFCKNRKERYVYDESEIKSPKIQKYIKTHTHKIDDIFGSYPKGKVFRIAVECFELKKWSVDDVLCLSTSDTSTAKHRFWNNGFRIEAEIDLVDLFDDYKEKSKIHEEDLQGKKLVLPHNLSEKRKEILKILSGLDNENKDLLILRDSRHAKRGWNWDKIIIYSKGKYDAKITNKLRVDVRIIKRKIEFWNRLRRKRVLYNKFKFIVHRKKVRITYVLKSKISKYLHGRLVRK